MGQTGSTSHDEEPWPWTVLTHSREAEPEESFLAHNLGIGCSLQSG